MKKFPQKDFRKSEIQTYLVQESFRYALEPGGFPKYTVLNGPTPLCLLKTRFQFQPVRGEITDTNRDYIAVDIVRRIGISIHLKSTPILRHKSPAYDADNPQVKRIILLVLSIHQS